MRTFAQKPKVAQQTTSAKSTTPSSQMHFLTNCDGPDRLSPHQFKSA